MRRRCHRTKQVLEVFFAIMKLKFVLYFIATSFIKAIAAEDCDKCVQKENCSSFRKLNQEAQDAWQVKFPCVSPEDNERSKLFGFAAIAKGDYVCCSNAIWGTSGNLKSDETNADQTPNINERNADFNTNYGRQNNYDDQGLRYNYPNTRTQRNSYDYDNNRNNNGFGSNQYPNNGGYQDNRNNNHPYNSNPGNLPYSYDGRSTQSPFKHYFNENNNPYATPSPLFPLNRPGSNGNINQNGQCVITSFPPEPETGCCGREASDTDRIIGRQPQPPTNSPNSPNYGNNNWNPTTTTTRYPPSSGFMSWPFGRPGYGIGLNRVARSIHDVNDNVTIDDRIAGGRETELEQFPWTVLLKVNFDYGTKRAAFNCGGSLISSRYVLTAGHCIYEEGATVIDVDIYLAEYDKRTFPKDCKNILGQGQKCLENVVIKSEEVVLHPQYEDSQLQNDVALIRLRNPAPYTDYIRPICLPSIDIDSPKFSNLRLAVAGWGRNGRYRSDIKQSTIVNLVPQEKCNEFYPSLSRRNLCAAGYSGQDTCKGDSGGPLMTVYGGKFQVVGIVSGKRADSPCGTSVPSLYTNVYHYLDWIRNSIRK
ncbi:unnamed protein product [Arctia plantaginis]|uniref:Peptidase S1 domain-containing protein n=1 Tax=Arctia plantaginis TaxID=874455 RepID=A0A8S0YXN6_ARCPL|nr:unnamed protein product [Arctia plantaginis]CAB3230010.1 unnamed protein product [Arctia plantaginis]